jgi:hypothetical protein
MILEFRDNLNRDAIDLYFEIKDDEERDIVVQNAKIQWSLTFDIQSYGIKSFNYELSLLLIPIKIDTVLEDSTIESKTIYAEVKFRTKVGKSNYICRIYEEILKDGKWDEDEHVSFPIKLVVDEKPSTETDNRSQVFVKYIELDLSSDEKQLKLSI